MPAAFSHLGLEYVSAEVVEAPLLGGVLELRHGAAAQLLELPGLDEMK